MDKKLHSVSTDYTSALKKQGYHIVGSHSAVKTCLWLNKSLRKEGVCYKSIFYGIQSHGCIQMTPVLNCNQSCRYCWRPIEIPVPEITELDSPSEIADRVIKEQLRLLTGYGGSKTTDMQKLKEAQNPKHVAISLIGEPTLYPYLPELINEFHKRHKTTFVVTNGTNPEMLKKINPTQLYMSLNAPDRETYIKTCNPMQEYWNKITESLKILQDTKTRTAIRVTLVKGLNMFNPIGYANLIKIANPDFVEVKAYMHLGYSRKRLSRDAMPLHKEVYDFAENIAKALDYKIASDVEISRVVLLTKNGTIQRL
ncbi:MAG: 4-demethylwyosine synthase TYW1, partial [Methanosarcinales archaeon]